MIFSPPNCEIYLWPRPFSLLEVEQTLQHCEHVAEVYPWTIVASTFIRWISSMFSICWSVFLFFSGGFQCKTSIPKRGVPTGGKLGITSDRLVMITKEYLHAIWCNYYFSSLVCIVFSDFCSWNLLVYVFWQCFIGTHTTYNFDFKALQATHRSTWCLQEHRN